MKLTTRNVQYLWLSLYIGFYIGCGRFYLNRSFRMNGSDCDKKEKRKKKKKVACGWLLGCQGGDLAILMADLGVRITPDAILQITSTINHNCFFFFFEDLSHVLAIDLITNHLGLSLVYVPCTKILSPDVLFYEISYTSTLVLNYFTNQYNFEHFNN